MKEYLLIFISSVIFINYAFANDMEIEWKKSLGGTAEESAYSLIKTNDNNFLVAGWTYSKGEGGSDIWLIKFDSDGQIIWEKTFGGLKDDKAYSIVQTTDSGFIIAGVTESKGVGNSDYWIIKLDSEANMEWNKTFGEFRIDKANSVIQTVDGGFVVAGSSEIGSGYSQIWIIKLNKSGVIEWSRDFGGNAEEDCFQIIQTNDGGFAFTGYSTSKSKNSWVVKLDNNASIDWESSFGYNSKDRLHSIMQDNNSNFILSGSKYLDVNNSDAWIIKLDENGTKKWEKTFGESGDDGVYSVVKKDENFIFTGFKSGDFNRDFWLIEVDENGTKKWEQSFKEDGENRAFSIIQLDNNKIILAGLTYDNINQNYDILLMKLNHKPFITDFVIDNKTPLSNTLITLDLKTIDINEDDLSYIYNYGDDLNDTSENTHSYAEDGNYTITAKVYDSYNGVAEANLSIRVGEPICLQSEKLVNHQCVEKNCRDDKYMCPKCIGEQTLEFYDNNSTGYCKDPICVEYEFLEAGICVYVVNQIPSLEIISSRDIAEAGESVEFLALADDIDGAIERYLWDFGDGSNSTISNPTHIYTSVGNYRVGCLISDDREANIIKYLNIQIEPSTNPDYLNNIDNIINNGGNTNDVNGTDSNSSSYISANIVVNTSKGQAPLTVNFSPNIIGNQSSISSYSWDFGNGATSNEKYPSYTYKNVGNYVAKLSVVNFNGVVIEAMKIIEVTQTMRINLSDTETQIIYFNRDSSELDRTIEVYNGVAPFNWGADYGDFKFKDYNKRISIYLPSNDSEITSDLITIEDNSTPRKKVFVEVKYLNSTEGNLTDNSRRLSLLVGWNLVSLPTKLNLTTKDMYKFGDFENVFKFNENWEIYSKNSNSDFNISYGSGFWIKSNQSNIINFEGDNYTPNLLNLVENRWYLLGTGDKINNIKDNFDFEAVWSYKNSIWIKNPQIINIGDGFWVKTP